MAKREMTPKKAGDIVAKAYETARSAGEKRWMGLEIIATYCDLDMGEIREGATYLTSHTGKFTFVNNRLGRG